MTVSNRSSNDQKGNMFFGIPQGIDSRYALFYCVRCTGPLLRSISRCHISRTSPDYTSARFDDERIVLGILVDENVLHKMVLGLFATLPGTSILGCHCTSRADAAMRLSFTYFTLQT